MAQNILKKIYRPTSFRVVTLLGQIPFVDTSWANPYISIKTYTIYNCKCILFIILDTLLKLRITGANDEHNISS